MPATGKSFFDESAEQSGVKAAIVAKYFKTWANVVKGAAKQRGMNLAYIDLFAGPGRYKDGTKSTPVMVLETAIADPDLSQMLVTIFNDADPDHSDSLRETLSEIDGISNLKHQPVINNSEIGDEIVKMFEEMNLVPTFFFVDPWGYKGLSLRLINSVLNDWGCDCIFFFNYNRINMGISNPYVTEHMNALFGEERGESLRKQLELLSPNQRELAIVEAIGEALQEMGGKFVLPFRFRRPDGERTSHHLIFVSKHIRGYDIMKGIMAKESSGDEDGVPTFEYNPSFRDEGLLFEFARPTEELGELLLAEFCGRTMTMKEIYDSHHVGHRFISRNYKDILKRLEERGQITANPPADSRRKNTFADSVSVTFP